MDNIVADIFIGIAGLALAVIIITNIQNSSGAISNTTSTIERTEALKYDDVGYDNIKGYMKEPPRIFKGNDIVSFIRYYMDTDKILEIHVDTKRAEPNKYWKYKKGSNNSGGYVDADKILEYMKNNTKLVGGRRIPYLELEYKITEYNEAGKKVIFTLE